MKYGLTEAARATSKSRSSIYRAIKSGLISATRRDDGQFEIDPAELHRVFAAATPGDSGNVSDQADDMSVGVLKREVELLREALEREQTHTREIRADLRELSNLLREEREERRQLTSLLVHAPAGETLHQRSPQWDTSKSPRNGRVAMPGYVVLGVILIAILAASLVAYWTWIRPDPPDPKLESTVTPAPAPPPQPAPWKPEGDGG